MEFRHLPVAGGIYDQHPDFIEGMMMMLQERGRWEREKAKKQEEEQKRKNGNHRMPSHPRRRR